MTPAASKNGFPNPAAVRKLRPRRAPSDDSVGPMAEPHVLRAARAVIGSIALAHSPELAREIFESVRPIIASADFLGLREQLGFRAIEELFDEKEPIDANAIARRIAVYDQAGPAFKVYEHRVTGPDSLPEDPVIAWLVHEVNDNVAAVDPHIAAGDARVVAEASRAQRHREEGEELAALAKRDPEAYRERLRELAAAEPEAPVSEVIRPQWMSPVARALQIGGYSERLPFTIASLNQATRGGLAAGKVVAIGGPPGGGKTSLLMQEARVWAEAGIPVGILAADEDADGLMIRFGQQCDIDRSCLEEGTPGARAELAAAMERMPKLLLVDAEQEEGATIEALADELVRLRAPGQPAVLILDSIQTVRTETVERHRDARERINAVVDVMKRIARRHRLIVIATSEVSRGAYNTADKSKQTSPLAAFKESGGIEYGVALAIVLGKFKDDDGKQGIELVVAKNRLGGHDDMPTIRLQMRSRTASFDEIPTPTDDERKRIAHVRREQMRSIIIKTIEQSPIPLTATKIVEALRLRSDVKGLGANRNVWFAVLGEMHDEGLIKNEGRGKPYVLHGE